MNIALITIEFVSEDYFDGGLANYTYRLAKTLIQLGHKPIVFVSSFKNEKIDLEGIEVHRIKIEKYDEWIYKNKFLCKPYTIAKRVLYKPLKWGSHENYFDIKSQSKQFNKRIQEIHQENKFDIIHYTHLSAVGLYRPKNIPSIARLSSSTLLCHEFGGYGVLDRSIQQQEELELKALKKMDGIFGPSRTIADHLSKQINKPVEVIETPYIEEKKELDNSVYEKELAGKKYILFFGSINLIKGAGTISKIIYNILEANPTYYFVFVGRDRGSEIPSVPMIQFIKEKAGKYADHVIHIESLVHTKLYPIIQNCEFCALPSRIDNFPNTCIEAMAHGKIVIGTKGNGFEQLIDQNESGFLIEVDDDKKLLETIQKIINLSPEEKKRIETNAKKRIELLKPEKVVVQLIDFYKKTISNFKHA